MAVIFLGAASGTTARSLLEGAWPATPGAFPWTTFSINVCGSLLLGMLLEAIAESGRDAGWRRGLRLGVGTGVLGGFTTYSTFSVETVLLLRSGHWLLATGYALASVVTGVGAAMLGVRLVRWTTRGLRRATVERSAR
ncbi:MAG TPA: CrcB family protein [Propionicimonas sp.]|nr:CrcB family protein [Propionicimonas sp.]